VTEIDDVVTDLRRRFDDFTSSQKRVAEAIVADPEFVAFATVDKLAARLEVSPSTIVRFAYRLGLDGYQDLQERVRQRVRLQMRSNVAGSDPASVLEHLGDSAFGSSLERDIQNLHRTVAEIDKPALDEAVRVINAARRVYVAGYLAADSLATFAALALARLHGNAHLLRNDGMLAPALFEAESDDVFLVFSFPPYASASLGIVEVARERGATVIAVTDSVISPVGQRGDVVLPAHVSGMASQNSLVAPLAVLNALINGVTASRPEAVTRYEQVMGSMRQWDAFVLKDDPS
jgi:DNA-binding MurR/RpiR family transcriptional regulator